MKFKRLIIYTLTLMLIATPIYSLANQVENENTVTEAVDTSAEAVILIDSNTGQTLYSKNAEQKMYPASTTKILTSIIAIENGNLQDTTVVKKSAISSIPNGYSSAYLVEGEKITIEQLLQVFLIHSANEAGNVLAEYVSGSITEFVNLMNQKAQELGCKNTHFINTNGIHSDEHYTTAEDLAIISKYCMKNQTFRNIVSMKKCIIPKTNKSKQREYKNTNALLDSNSKNYLAECIGIKTGYTSEAKNCLISACSKNGLELIAVVLGAPTLKTGESTRYTDSINLYNFGYSNYAIKKVASKNDIIYTAKIKNANKETRELDLKMADDISALINTKDENISYIINLNDDLSAPISAGSVVGTITYKVNDYDYTENLIATHDVIKSDFVIFLLYGALGILILIILLTIICIIKIRKNKKYVSRH